MTQWTFGLVDDRNVDDWPDGWTRVVDRDHPRYVEMQIVADQMNHASEVARARALLTRIWRSWQTGELVTDYIPEVVPPKLQEALDRFVLNKCLEIRMNGGKAEVRSPLLELDPRYAYRVKADMLVDALQGHRAWVEFVLFDEEKNPVQVVTTPGLHGTTNWIRNIISDTASSNPKIRFGQIRIRVEPTELRHLFGVVRIDNVRVCRIAHLILATSAPLNVVVPGQPFEVRCDATTMQDEATAVIFRLRSLEGDLLDEQLVELEDAPDYARTPLYVGTDRAHATEMPTPPTTRMSNYTAAAVAVWNTSIVEPGYYVVEATFADASADAPSYQLGISVIDQREFIDAGVFGWSFPRLNEPFGLNEIPELAARFGSGWIKVPVWFSITDKELADALATFVARLDAFGGHCVGVIDRPPQQYLTSTEVPGTQENAYEVFNDLQAWEPLLEPVLTRLGTKVGWFQLGGESDRSLQRSGNLAQLVANARSRLRVYAPEAKVALVWGWLDVPPGKDAQHGEQESVWDAIQFRAQPPLTAEELRRYIEAEGDPDRVWACINPLPRDEYDLQTRVLDLAKRMLCIRQTDVKAAFLIQPSDPRTGLFTSKGTATEMLIPWRNLVDVMGAANYAGSVELPYGSVNHIFEKNGSGTMIMWSHRPVTEQFYFGEDVSAHDVWGRHVEVENVRVADSAVEQQIPVGAWPVIVRGLDIDAILFRQSFELITKQLEPRPDQRNELQLKLANHMQDNVSGYVTIASTELLGEEANVRVPFRLAGGETTQLSVPVLLRPDVIAGHHTLRFDFSIKGRKKYRFRLQRSLFVGSSDIDLRFTASRVSPNVVQLVVDATNRTEHPMNFDCKVFFPDAPYQRFFLTNVPTGQSQHTIYLVTPVRGEPRQHWIRCENVERSQVLNYQVVF